jgi:hypothetical protein
LRVLVLISRWLLLLLPVPLRVIVTAIYLRLLLLAASVVTRVVVGLTTSVAGGVVVEIDFLCIVIEELARTH